MTSAARQWLTITPHKISLAILINTYINDSELDNQTKSEVGWLLIDEITNLNEFHEKSLADLFRAIAQLQPDGELVKQRLWGMLSRLESPDYLHEFLAAIGTLLEQQEDTAQSPLDRSSVLGLFLRKLTISFRELMFEALTRLFDDLTLYRDTCQTLLSAEDTAQDMPQLNIPLSPLEFETFIESEARNVERAFGRLSEAEIQSSIAHIKHSMPSAYQIEFLTYMNAVAHGDVNSAVESLHEYFDRSLPTSALTDTERLNIGLLPYACLNLASLYLKFGQVDDGLQLMYETIYLAQESKDEACITRALTLMHKLLLASCKGEIHSLYMLLQRLVKQAQRINMPDLASEEFISLASSDLRFPKLESRLQSLTESALNLETQPQSVWHHLNSAASTVTSAATGAKNNSEIVDEILATVSEVRADSWHVFGNADMSRVFNQNALDTCYGPDSDTCQTTASSNLALCKAALALSEQGQSRAALQLLLEARDRYPLSPVNNTWLIYAGRVLFNDALNRGQHDKASTLCTRLLAITPHQGTALSEHIDTCHRIASLYLAVGDLTRAKQLITGLLDLCSSRGLELQSVNLLVTLADIHLKSGSHVTALPHVLKSLTLTTQYHLTALQVIATIQLAEIQSRLFNDTQRACHLLDSVRVSLPHCPLVTRVRAHLLRVTCQLQHDTPDLAAAVTNLESLAAECARGGMVDSLKEVYYLLARVHHELDQTEARDRYATLFGELDRSRARVPCTHVYYLNSESIEVELKHLQTTV